jgi:hypothetical protein
MMEACSFPCGRLTEPPFEQGSGSVLVPRGVCWDSEPGPSHICH